jgi:hypothetical protein
MCSCLVFVHSVIESSASTYYNKAFVDDLSWPAPGYLYRNDNNFYSQSSPSFFNYPMSRPYYAYSGYGRPAPSQAAQFASAFDQVIVAIGHNVRIVYTYRYLSIWPTIRNRTRRSIFAISDVRALLPLVSRPPRSFRIGRAFPIRHFACAPTPVRTRIPDRCSTKREHSLRSALSFVTALYPFHRHHHRRSHRNCCSHIHIRTTHTGW